MKNIILLVCTVLSLSGYSQTDSSKVQAPEIRKSIVGTATYSDGTKMNIYAYDTITPKVPHLNLPASTYLKRSGSFFGPAIGLSLAGILTYALAKKPVTSYIGMGIGGLGLVFFIPVAVNLVNAGNALKLRDL